MTSPVETRRLSRWIGYLGTTLTCVAILGAASATVVVINRTEPTAERINSVRKSAALVETVTVQRGNYRPRLTVLGTVTAAQDITLSPRVRGQVLEIASSFAPGQTVQQGDLLLQIDPADFNHALSIRESELRQAEASLKIEEGQSELAQKELEFLEDSISEINRDLVLRVPQIQSIQAQIQAAQAAVEQAKLDLARTKITAPFDAQIIRRTVNVGSQVSPGDNLARLVGVDEYWVSAAVPIRNLKWLTFADSDQQGSNVTLSNPGVWPENTTRQATVARMLGTLDPQTRLAQVLISVPDPLALQSEDPPLILDAILQTEIEGREIKSVVRLSRDYLRERDTIWVMTDGKLEIREPEIVFRDADYAYIQTGLESGEEVVATTLSTVAEGIGLKKAAGVSQPAASTDDAAPNEETSNEEPAR